MSGGNQLSAPATNLSLGVHIRKPTFAQALQMARELYSRMPENQRVERERLLAAKETRFFTKDGVPPLVKMMAERICNGPAQQRASPAPLTKATTVHHTPAQQRPAPQPAQTQRSNTQHHLLRTAVQQPPITKPPTLVQPTAQQQTQARLPTREELQARQWLSQGVRLDGQTPTGICMAHNEQVRDLYTWSSTSTGGYFTPVVPSTPEAFRESVTSETALLPMCRGCAVEDGAVTVAHDAQGQVFHQLQVMDTCTCASNVANVNGGSCWFCELGRIEAAKLIAVMTRAAKQQNGEPLLMVPTNHQALTCGCGQLVQDLPEAARKCVGCGGVKTAPFGNYAGNDVIFMAVGEKVEAVFDATTGQPIAAAPTNGIPQSVPQHQLPAVTGAASHGMGTNFNFPEGQSLDDHSTEDQLSSIAQLDRQHGRKRKIAFDDAAGSQSKRPRPQSQRARVKKPREGERLLFDFKAATELTQIGLNVFTHYHQKDVAITPARRAEILLRDNLGYMFKAPTAIHAMLQCGLEEHEAGMLARDVHGRYGAVVTGAQILKLMLENGMLPSYAMTSMPNDDLSQSRTASQQEHVPLYPLFNVDEKLALMKLGFQVHVNSHPDGSQAAPAYRAETLLKDNMDKKLEISRLVEALGVCGVHGWRVDELERDLAGEQRAKHVTVEHAMARMRSHGVIDTATAPTSVSVSADVDIGGQRMNNNLVDAISWNAGAGAPSPASHMAGLRIDPSTGEDASDNFLDPLLRPQNVESADAATAPVALPEMEAPFAFSPQDTHTLRGLGLQSVPALDANLSPGERAKRLFEANKELRHPNDLDVVLETCGFDQGLAKEMVGSFYEFYDDDASCSDLLTFFEGEFASG